MGGSGDQGLAAGGFWAEAAAAFLLFGDAVGLVAAGVAVGLTAGGAEDWGFGIGLALAQRDATIRFSPSRSLDSASEYGSR